jgi:acyl-CoA synthetase (NDP forming)
MESEQNARKLDALFRPKSIAIVGASETGLYPAGVLRNLLRYGYKGRIFPVNPRRETVQGLRSYAKLLDIEEEIDLVLIIVPRGFVLDILDQCAQKGAKSVVIITSGFGEADDYGKQLQQKMAEFAKKTGIIICGPNTAGLANLHDNVILTARLDPAPILGNVAFASQSGALMMAMYGDFRDKEIGLSVIVSTGNQVDLELSECIRGLVEDEKTRVIATYIEGLKDANRFLAAADLAIERGKPIVALKVGKTLAGAAAAMTHTGSLTGSDAVYDAVFKQKGIIRVDDIDELVNTAKVLSLFVDRLPKGDGLAIISQSGGLGSLTADLCGDLGLNLPELSGGTLEKLVSIDELLTFGVLRNPADVRGEGTRAAMLPRVLQPFIDDEKYAYLVILLARPAVGTEDLGTVSTIASISKTTPKPMFVVWVGRTVPDPGSDLDAQPFRVLEKSGVPVFYNPRSCLVAIRHLADYAKFRQRSMNLQSAQP